MPPTRWTPTTSSESSNPNRYFRPTAKAQIAPASRPSRIAAHGHEERTGRGDGDQAGDGTGRDAEGGRVAVADPLDERSSRAAADAVATCVLVKASAARPLAASAEPALKPNQPNHSRPAPSMTNGRLCGRIWVLGPADPLAEDERQREARGAGVDVDRGSTREVLDAPCGEPAGAVAVRVAEVEDPVGDREVDERRPDGDEDGPAEELRAVSDRAGDQGRRDDREHQLEHREREGRDRSAGRRSAAGPVDEPRPGRPGGGRPRSRSR